MEGEWNEISDTGIDDILYGHMTPKKAAEYLREGKVSVRSFSDTLRIMYPGQDILRRLVNFYLIVDPDANLLSVEKKLRNWLAGRNYPHEREDFFRIAFALRLTEEQLSYLLGLCTDYAIQYRDSRELVLSWFLRGGYGYLDACEFCRTLPPPRELEKLEEGVTSRITHELQSDFLCVQTLDELRACYLRNQGRFGKLHLRSYYYFERYLNQLIHPRPSFAGDGGPDYSIEAIMDIYLSLRIPMSRSRAGFTLVQKLIKQNWPNATAIKNIRGHTVDVPRKLLLLLYVVTENCGFADDAYTELDEEYITLEERVQDHWWTLGAMLSDCGMAPLDLRNAFDWLILYAICADPDEAMSERLEAVIAELYGDLGK